MLHGPCILFLDSTLNHNTCSSTLVHIALSWNEIVGKVHWGAIQMDFDVQYVYHVLLQSLCVNCMYKPNFFLFCFKDSVGRVRTSARLLFIYLFC